MTRPFPQEAVKAAIERREESAPYLLGALEWVVQKPEAADDAGPEYMAHIFALYLLAQFRETRGFPLVSAQLFRLRQYESLTGDVATESLGHILASRPAGGDVAPIQALVEEIRQPTNGCAAPLWRHLLRRAQTVQGLHPRELLSRYYGDLILSRLERAPSNVWGSLILACADLRMSEHLDAIRVLYQKGIADPFFDPLVMVEEDITSPPDVALQEELDRLIDNTVEEMDCWHCFSPESEMEDEERGTGFSVEA